MSPGVKIFDPVIILTDRPKDDELLVALCQRVQVRTGEPPIVSVIDAVDTTNRICINLYDLDHSMLANCGSESFERIRDVLLASSGMLWVSSGAYKTATHPHRNMAQGLCRTVRSEAGKPVPLLDLDPRSKLGASEVAKLITDAFEVLLEGGSHATPDMEFAEEHGQLAVPRIVEDMEMNTLVRRQTSHSEPYLQSFHQPGRRLKLDIEHHGALDTIFFKDDEEAILAADQVEIHVHVTGMNFKDVVISMGQLPSTYIGVECSGTIARVGSSVTDFAIGDRVCAVAAGAYHTFARCKSTSAVKMPDDMTMEVGASIPIVYCTAYYGIVEIARLLPGERILIHAAAGGVGQAAIQLAQMIGAEIYATVGTPEKEALLREKYGIPQDHIFSSRTTSFAASIRRITKGQGVDVVINSLAGEFLRETWDCIGHFGRFIEIGKRDITNNTRLEMRRFDHNALFSSVDLTVVATERPKLMAKLMNAVMEAMATKSLQPIHPITMLPISEVEKGLRLLQGGKTIGKLVINQMCEGQVKASNPMPGTNMFSDKASYLILGGTGGLGRSLAEWMVKMGAGKVVLVSRSGNNLEVERMVEKLGKLGSRIHVRACDISEAGRLDTLVAELSQSATPCRGVIHATMVLRVRFR